LWYDAPAILPAGGQDEVELHHTKSCKHSLVLPEDGRTYRPKDVELIEIINKITIVASSWLFILLQYL
jgi:hypothetical protein